MIARSTASTHSAGPIGPVAVSVALLLLFAAPLMRGGNRQVALIVLETISMGFLLSVWLRTIFSSQSQALAHRRNPVQTVLLAFLLLAPAWLALVHLVPVPAVVWSGTSGRGIYLQLLQDAGITSGSWLPLSLVPDVTKASLLAGLPLIAGFLAGYLARLAQVRLLLGLVVAMAFAQILLGLLQMAGGAQSPLYFGGDGGRPFGTFANANHFANYIGMALAAYVALACSSLLWPSSRQHHYLAARFALPLWIAGGLVLVVGILMSRSRGAALTGLPAGMLALGLALSMSGRSNGWRSTLTLVGGVVVGAVALVGLGSVLSRFDLGGIANAASIRGLLTATTLAGAQEFWPWGAGWGSYAAVYPRFEPMGSDGIVDYAHHDYAQMLFEGGIFSVLLAAAFLWLAGCRAVLLTRSILLNRAFTREEMTSALCGLGLLGLLLHSLVDFNLHIPANAILGAMLAGIYLRPFGNKGAPG